MAAPSRRGVRWRAGAGPTLAALEFSAVLLVGLVTGLELGSALAAAGVGVLVAHLADLQRPRLVLSVLDDVPGLLGAAAVATLVGAALGAAPVAFGLLSLALLTLAHATSHGAVRALRRSGRRRRVLVVGTGPTARGLALTLLVRPDLGLQPVGFVAAGRRVDLAQARGLPLALLAPVSALPRAMTETAVDHVVLALDAPAGEEEVAALDGLLATAAGVHAVPTPLPGARSHTRHPAELVGGTPLVRLHRHGSWPPVRALKRAVEVLTAGATLAVLLPPAALLALLAWLETGDVLVRQRRPGVAGSTTVTRFRTRRSRSVARPGTTFSVAISGRLGPIGRLLRLTRLDGLPELILSLSRRLRYAGGVRLAIGPTAAADPDEAEVDAGQLTR